jgi:large subunit ribosomal protein LP0
MVKGDRATWKANYFVRLERLLNEFPRCFIVGVDNVGSKQMQQIRFALRGSAEIIMGKNTMIRKVIRGYLETNPAFEKLLTHVKTNIGFVFTKGDLTEVRAVLDQHRVAAPAKAGAVAPVSVVIPAQNTGLGPEKTSFFQALHIPTKITRGTIEILGDVPLITAGDKVALSEATLLNMLKISPFAYGMILLQVYDDGSIYDPAVLDITQDDMRQKFLAGVKNVAAVSLEIGYPTLASAPHSIINGFKRCLAVAVETDITFKEAEKVKEYLKDPSKFAAAAPAAAPAKAAPKEAKAAAKKVESESESDEDIGMSLFD